MADGIARGAAVFWCCLLGHRIWYCLFGYRIGISCLDTLFEFVFAKNFLGRSASASEVTRGRYYTASFRYIVGELGHVYCPNEMCFAEVEHAQDLVFNFRRSNYIVACACFWFSPIILHSFRGANSRTNFIVKIVLNL